MPRAHSGDNMTRKWSKKSEIGPEIHYFLHRCQLLREVNCINCRVAHPHILKAFLEMVIEMQGRIVATT